MKTRVFRLDLNAVPDLAAAITATCDAQLLEGFKLATTFVMANNLVMIFQQV